MDLSASLAEVHDRIERAGGDPGAVTVVAVTKTLGVECCRAAVAAGLVHLGENRAQELLAKANDLDDRSARWHFIGRLQTNKVRSIAPHVAMWESVDRPELVEELVRRAPGANVLVQVNISGEPQKGGCEPAATASLVAGAIDAGLAVGGLMGVGPLGPPEAARPGFRLLRTLADDLGLPVRSMGMSADLEVAVQEGATMVRVGSGLFGPRPRRPADLPPN